MKKNWFMRIAGVMLVLAMITSCFVGSTFAKYVTRAQGEDNARVAKFGILLYLDGGVFADKYAATDEDYLAAGGTYSVVADPEGEKVVAPGTNSEQVGTNLVATVTGTPEVAVRYSIEGTVTDVVLEKGTYTDYTMLVPKGDDQTDDDPAYGYYDTFTLDKDYAPIKWNMVISKGGTSYNVADLLYDNIPEANIAQAEAYGLTRGGCSFFDAIAILQKVCGNQGYMNIVDTALGQVVSGGRNFMLEADKDAGTFKMSYDFDPGKEMGFTFELTWEWFFDNTVVIDDEGNLATWCNDQADTYLGNVAAGVFTDDKAHTTISATLTASATQID